MVKLSESPVEEKLHKKLLKAVEKLDKAPKWIKKIERFEPTLHVSELDLVKSGVTDSDLVREYNIVKPLSGKPQHREINKQSNAFKRKASTLHKPPERPVAEKLKREVGFENTKKELQKWDAIITKNRVASQLEFNRSYMRMEPTEKFVKRFTIQSELQKELAALEPEKENKKESKRDEYSLTVGEILLKRREAAKFRAQQSYKEAKAHRLKKIKSKKFHRIERKAMTKRQLKEFELLQTTDPSAALEKLEQLDKARAEERMSLRHKSTGQWAKNKQIRAKYDKDSRQVLAQQLSISRELTQKVRKNNDSDEEEEPEGSLQLSSSAKDNPWINGVKTEAEVNDFVSGYRKYWEEKNKLKGNQPSVPHNSKPEKPLQVSRKHVSSSLNPVVEVQTIQMNSNTDKSSKKNKKQKQKIQKNTETKKSSKIVKPKKKAGTSEWAVEALDDVETSTESKVNFKSLNDIFDTMEDKIQQKIKKKLGRVKRKMRDEPEEVVKSNDNDSDNDHVDLSFKKRKLRPEIDEALNETSKNKQMAPAASSTQIDLQRGKSLLEASKKSEKSTVEIDPNAFINVKPKHLKTQLPDDVTGDDEGLDDSDNELAKEESQHTIINEAFADDDVVDEFRKEKESEIKKSEPDDLDMRLPGWGSWGGKNLKVSMRKKRRFIMKFPKEAPRKDENKGNVIIIEDTSKVKEHQVNELPYPFTSVADYEASIRAPIGRNFIPENAHRRLIAPAVKTKLGRIIEPMDEEFLIKKNAEIKGDLGAKDKKIRKTKKTIK